MLEGRVGKRRLRAYRWLARKGNTGKGISRDYPMTSEDYRVQAAVAEFKRRVARSMFKAVSDQLYGLVRGHGIPHADTMTNTPTSGGTISTTVKDNYYPELEGWGEVQRKRREMQARKRGVPIVQVNDYGTNPAKTENGTPIPSQLWFVELTGLAADGSYKSSKTYTAKAYRIVYKNFDYESLPRKKPNSDRRRLHTLRVKKLPKEVQQFVRHSKAVPSSYKFSF